MKYQEFYIEKYDWWVFAYYDTTAKNIEDIMDCLYEMNCNADVAIQAYDNIAENTLNTGLTFSKNKKSCIVLSRASSKEQFASTFCHELHHCAMHIAKEYRIDPYGEEPAYIIGYLGEKMLPYASKFLCDCCNNKSKNNNNKNNYEKYDF